MPPGCHITRHGKSRFWRVYEDNELLCVPVYKKGAIAVAKRITELKQEIETLKGTGYSIPAPTTIVTAAERIPPDKPHGDIRQDHIEEDDFMPAFLASGQSRPHQP